MTATAIAASGKVPTIKGYHWCLDRLKNMFKPQVEDRIKAIDKEFLKVVVIDAPASMLVAIGLYAKFAADGDAFLPFLNNQNNVNIILGLGVGISAWCVYKIMTLGREKAALKKSME